MFFLNFHRKGPLPGHGITPRDVMDFLMPFADPDESGYFEDDRALLIQCVTWNTAPSKLEPAPFHDAEAGLHGASWARIDNREELAGELGMRIAAVNNICDTGLICRCYRKWQDDCIEHLIGDFVFVIYDERKKRVFCGRDHMGVKPFYYHLSDNRFICATSLAALMHVKDLTLNIREKWIVDYLAHLSMSFDETPYREIRKLPPAHTLAVTPEKRRLKQYFELSAEPELKLKDSREYVDAYREQLECAIKCRLNTTFPIGTELSGGIDSSTITAYAAKFMESSLNRLHAFAFANSELEPQYILSVSQAYGLLHTHVVAGRPRNPDAVLERSLKILGYPVEHGNATYHEPFYQLAEKFEIRTLLSGFGGDEFGTTIHGYMVPMEMILKHRYKDLFNILPGKPLFRLLRLVKLGLRKLKTHDFTRPAYNSRFLAAWNKRWPHQIVAEDMVQAHDLKNRYFETARFDAGYTDLKRFTLEKRWMPFVPTRMENCTLMAAARKIDYRWPLLDVRLVKLWLSIPAKENYFRGMGRYLHRRAINGVVPDLVTWKKGKDMGNIVDGFHPGQKDMDTMSKTDLHPELARLIDVKKLDRQITDIAQLKSIKADGLTFQFSRNVGHWLKPSIAGCGSAGTGWLPSTCRRAAGQYRTDSWNSSKHGLERYIHSIPVKH